MAIEVVINEYTSCIAQFLKEKENTLLHCNLKKVKILKKTAAKSIDIPFIRAKFIKDTRKDIVDLVLEQEITEAVPSTSTLSSPSKKQRVSSNEMLATLVNHDGKNPVVDLASITNKSSHYSYKKKLMSRYGLKLKYALTIDEHDVLTRLSSGKDLNTLILLRNELFSWPDDSISPSEDRS
ncbi:hypothetical protein INT45_011907 [Circinella minor]|uniref:Uncharacterized protein n=1 Tax=Circinella minor TaxID=1195481 RepID=A0A8H7RX36_9FUNG|nr:hypothetical protein INT45_011907 [Circinella minor]